MERRIAGVIPPARHCHSHPRRRRHGSAGLLRSHAHLRRNTTRGGVANRSRAQCNGSAASNNIGLHARRQRLLRGVLCPEHLLHVPVADVDPFDQKNDEFRDVLRVVGDAFGGFRHVDEIHELARILRHLLK